MKRWKAALLGLSVVVASASAAEVVPANVGLIGLDRPSPDRINECVVKSVPTICLPEAATEITWQFESKCSGSYTVFLYKFFGVSRSVTCAGQKDGTCPTDTPPLACYVKQTVTGPGRFTARCAIGAAKGCWKYDVYLNCDPKTEACQPALDPDVRKPPR